MLVLIRKAHNGELAALDCSLITNIDSIGDVRLVYASIGDCWQEATSEPIDSLVRRINAGRAGNTPALPPEVEA